MAKKAQATNTINPLHFEDLEPHRFEDLIRQLLYDFRQWYSIEAVGRLGSDEGIDIRAVERKGFAEEEREINEEEESFATDESRSARVWVIQCKREKSIGPKKVKQIVENDLSQQEEVPYGYMIVAPCDFSKRSRDSFRDATLSFGVEEFYLWGKAELEDLLFQPRYDHLLFAYFGVSLQIRRRTSRTQLRSKLTLKRALTRHLGELRKRSYKQVLIRDPRHSDYPRIDNEKEFWESPPWRYWDFFMHRPPDQVMFVKRKCYAYYNPQTDEWDALLDLDLGVVYPQLFDAPEEPPERKALQQEYHEVWDHGLPAHCKAWYYELGIIPYDRILAIDDLGDACNEPPHLLVDYRDSTDPFEGQTFQGIEPVGNGHGHKILKTEGLKQCSFLTDLSESLRRERARYTDDERIELALQEMVKVREAFIETSEEYLSNWYWSQVDSRVKRQVEHTLSLGKKELSRLKQTVKELQEETKGIINEHFGAEELWWDQERGDQNYSYYGNRAPDELDIALRYAAGHLAPILKEFGYTNPNVKWVKRTEKSYYSTDETPYYPGLIQWSEKMRTLVGRYETLRQRVISLERNKVTHPDVQPEPDKMVAKLWEKA
ncbi:MAG: restriction endonuclease [Cyanobacteria bacterium P01_H01_bin.105]